jgi:thiosulfate dehydrogenase [quinone] large subunit
MKYTNAQLAFFLLRIGLGVNFFLHGLVRMDHLVEFANGVGSGFQETMMPVTIARGYAFFIPFFELIIGALLILGIKVRAALFTGGLFMITLIAGKCIQQDWSAVGTQMVYLLVFYFLIANKQENVLALVK